MAIKLSFNLIVGNAFISTKRKQLSIDELYKYIDIVDNLLPKDYYTYISKYSLDIFLEQFSFIITMRDNILNTNEDYNLLRRYFRVGIPIEVAKTFDKAGEQLNNHLKENQSDLIKNLNNIEKQNFDVLAIPYNKPFIISKDKIHELINQKPNEEIKEKNNELLEKIKMKIKRK